MAWFSTNAHAAAIPLEDYFNTEYIANFNVKDIELVVATQLEGLIATAKLMTTTIPV